MATDPKKKIPRVRSFCVTINNWTQEMLDEIQKLDIIRFGIMGEEVGESGTPHLQGYIQLLKPQTISALQKKLKAVGIKAALIVAKGNVADNVKYCSKEGNKVHHWGEATAPGKRTDLHRIRDMIEAGVSEKEILAEYPGQWYRYRKSFKAHAGIVENDDIMQKLQGDLTDAKLKPWQEKALAKLQAQDDRKVLWVVDPAGNTGKSFLAKWLNVKYDAFCVTSGKTADIAYAYNKEKIVVFDFVRQKEEFVNYGVIEAFKNGILFSPKYESKSIRFYSALVVVFSNFEPDQAMLSEDRWDIMHITKMKTPSLQAPWAGEMGKEGFIFLEDQKREE